MDTRPQPFDPGVRFTFRGDDDVRIEAFSATEFWRWGFSNVQENVTRGILAEFIVARALGVQLQARQSWDAADLVTASGLRIEVKSTGYIQAWDQGGNLSKISFDSLKTKLWIPESGEAPEPDYHADVYVFCLQNARTRATYDPLDLDQWEFWVLSRAQLAVTNQRSISYGTLVGLAGSSVVYANLAALIERAAGSTVVG